METVTAIHPRAQIVLCTTIPSEPLVAEYDERVRRIAAARDLPLIDVHNHMKARSAAGDWDWHLQPRHLVGRQRHTLPADNPTGLKGDLHPNLYGTTVIAELYFKHLKELLEKPVI